LRAWAQGCLIGAHLSELGLRAVYSARALARLGSGL